MNAEHFFCISIFFTIFSVLATCLHFYFRWRIEDRKLNQSIDKARKVVEDSVYRPLDEIISRRKLEQLHDDGDIEIFLSTCEVSDLMRIKQNLEQRLDHLQHEEKP